VTETDDLSVWHNADYDRDLAHGLVRLANFATDQEALTPRVSRVANPDGSTQRETAAEFTHRITETAVLYLLEMGLLVMPEDVEARLEGFFPSQRITT
jgi:hypothetical protein